ncbi:hypothetical protein CYMTET_35091 [Cymbomonas tetramitiformis]|uniref:Apple domain-containing protein n=1 Tax=Cymbomonas tetramitiformis TaxID=36881 RepID=A0AAE0KPI1_9CHLO|nr:hypothetical protein CYMTET_35091 [Cymbomonas tetramitiformis]
MRLLLFLCYLRAASSQTGVGVSGTRNAQLPLTRAEDPFDSQAPRRKLLSWVSGVDYFQSKTYESGTTLYLTTVPNITNVEPTCTSFAATNIHLTDGETHFHLNSICQRDRTDEVYARMCKNMCEGYTVSTCNAWCTDGKDCWLLETVPSSMDDGDEKNYAGAIQGYSYVKIQDKQIEGNNCVMSAYDSNNAAWLTSSKYSYASLADCEELCSAQSSCAAFVDNREASPVYCIFKTSTVTNSNTAKDTYVRQGIFARGEHLVRAPAMTQGST